MPLACAEGRGEDAGTLTCLPLHAFKNWISPLLPLACVLLKSLAELQVHAAEHTLFLHAVHLPLTSHISHPHLIQAREVLRAWRRCRSVQLNITSLHQDRHFVTTSLTPQAREVLKGVAEMQARATKACRTGVHDFAQ